MNTLATYLMMIERSKMFKFFYSSNILYEHYYAIECFNNSYKSMYLA